MGKGNANRRETLSLASQLEGLEDPFSYWHELYKKSPELFALTDRSIALPTEYGVLAFLYALKSGEIRPLKLRPEVRELAARGAGYLRSLTGLEIPKLKLFQVEPAHAALNGSARAFSGAAEPQTREVVILNQEFSKAGDPYEVACTVLHEAHHAALSQVAKPKAKAYLEPLTANLDELTVGFSERMISYGLRNGGQVPNRGAFERAALELEHTRSGRWTQLGLDLTPGLESPEMIKELNSLDLELLKSGDDQLAVEIINRKAGVKRSLREWLECF